MTVEKKCSNDNHAILQKTIYLNCKEFGIMAGSVIEITDENFETEVKNSAQPVLVDFWAEWCGPCRMLAPTIEELADEYQGRVKIGKLDTDKSRDTALKFGINAIPTLILFNQGEVVDTKVGMVSKKDLKAALDEVA